MNIRNWLLVGLLSIFPSTGFSQGSVAQAKIGDNVVTITQEPCTNQKVLALLPPLDTIPFEFKAGTVLWEGETIPLCWTVMEGSIFLVDATGDAGSMSQDQFKPLVDI